MKMRFIVIIVCLLKTLLFIGCEEKCTITCGPEQDCVKGVCQCPDDTYQIGTKCKAKSPHYFLGNLECDCEEEFIISKFFLSTGQWHEIDSGSKSGSLLEKGDNYYKYWASKSCKFGDKSSTHAETTVTTLNDDELKVDVKFIILPSQEVLAECSSIFKH